MEFPIRFADTERIAPDTFVIRQIAGEGMGPVVHYLNSMVIAGSEPVIVDTGAALTREGWLERAFELVDPADVRWIYLSHDDSDHTGNVHEVLERCPNASLVGTWFMLMRMADSKMLPLDRVRLVNDGEAFRAGDRELVAVTPPVYDSPTTRGLYDTRSRVYWASDAFATAVPHLVDDVEELDPAFYAESFLHTQQMLSPWVGWLDCERYGAHVERVASLNPRYVASAHGPTLHGGQIARAFDLFGALPNLPAQAPMGQSELDAVLGALAAGPVAA
jgi:flavorubredoxin